MMLMTPTLKCRHSPSILRSASHFLLQVLDLQNEQRVITRQDIAINDDNNEESV